MRLLAHVALMAAFTAGSMLADDWAKTFTVSGRPELRVETDDAAVVVLPWSDKGDAKRIEARVTTSRWRIAPGEVEIREYQTGDRVELVVRCHSSGIHFDVGNRSILVELHVPRRIQSDIHTGDGSIRVSGLEGETRLRTGDGSVEADGLDGALDATTGDGHMKVRGRLDALTLRTGDGGIEADVLPGSKMRSGWRLESGDGAVRVRLPRDFAVELDLHTGDGHMSVDFPVPANARSGRNLRARMNGGVSPLTIRTEDGSIHIGRI